CESRARYGWRSSSPRRAAGNHANYPAQGLTGVARRMIVLIMGTTGAGKTTVGKLLAEKLSWIFLDADDFHPPASIAKMKKGIPLDDADRAPWLAAIHDRLEAETAARKSCVLACSALKESYRETIGAGLAIRTVYLKGSYEEMRAHILARHGHFAGEG